jgi:hypothetical protein
MKSKLLLPYLDPYMMANIPHKRRGGNMRSEVKKLQKDPNKYYFKSKYPMGPGVMNPYGGKLDQRILRPKRKPSQWNKLVKQLLLENPNIPFAQVVKKASSIYRK